ncbi:MAG: hypothetical protein JO020_10925, partial [Chloroflexi bacterium]|nr:hypothetical protein [Chloroflexota bacterium]
AGQLGREVEDRAVLDALAHQVQLGMPVLTDGELRRDAWQTDMPDAVAGFVDEYPVVKRTLPNGQVVELEMHTKAVKDHIKPIRRITGGFLPFLQQHVQGSFKVMLPRPAMVSRGAIHMCRGSRTTERGTGDYEWLAERLRR